MFESHQRPTALHSLLTKSNTSVCKWRRQANKIIKTDRRQRAFSLTSSSVLWTSTFDVVFARRHHSSSVVHSCRLSATEFFRSLLLVSDSGTIYKVTSRLHCRCEFSTVVSRRPSFQQSLSRISVVPVK